MPFSIFRLRSHDIFSRLDELASLLIDCVDGGASVSFISPLSHEKAVAFWQQMEPELANHSRILLVCEDAQQQIVGTVQLIIGQPENQPHRADIAKLLVHSRVRRQGIARALMEQVEREAQEAGKWLLVLDTASGSGAETFYANAGWIRCGEIPDYAVMPDGTLSGTTVFYKHLSSV